MDVWRERHTTRAREKCFKRNGNLKDNFAHAVLEHSRYSCLSQIAKPDARAHRQAASRAQKHFPTRRVGIVPSPAGGLQQEYFHPAFAGDARAENTRRDDAGFIDYEQIAIAQNLRQLRERSVGKFLTAKDQQTRGVARVRWNVRDRMLRQFEVVGCGQARVADIVRQLEPNPVPGK